MDRAFRRTCSTALALLALTTAAHAAVFKPTTTFDTFDGVCDEDCSLRDAVAASNANPGSDTILLESGLYVLSLVGANEDLGATGDLDVVAGEELKIIGVGPSLPVIDGFGQFGGDRVFDVRGSLDLNGILVRNGSATGGGGGILSFGQLTLTNSVVLGNQTTSFGFGGGILSEGELTIRNSVVAGNTADGGGGGLAVGGLLTVVNSEISSNESLNDFGGGAYLFSEARASFTNVNFSGNRAAIAGGGIYLEPPLFPGSREFRNVTFEANFAPVGPDCAGVGCPAN
jgi:CSLREA domain-containing protein